MRDIVWLCTPQHTGTHFLRLLLELHPHLSYWKGGGSQTHHQSQVQVFRDYALGCIELSEFKRQAEVLWSGDEAWTGKQLEAVSMTVPKKDIKRTLLHNHSGFVGGLKENPDAMERLRMIMRNYLKTRII